MNKSEVRLHVGRFRRPTCNGLGDLRTYVFLDVKNKIYNQIYYLIDYVVNGLHSWYKIKSFKEMCREPISQHHGLATVLDYEKAFRPCCKREQLTGRSYCQNKYFVLLASKSGRWRQLSTLLDFGIITKKSKL